METSGTVLMFSAYIAIYNPIKSALGRGKKHDGAKQQRFDGEKPMSCCCKENRFTLAHTLDTTGDKTIVVKEDPPVTTPISVFVSPLCCKSTATKPSAHSVPIQYVACSALYFLCIVLSIPTISLFKGILFPFRAKKKRG